MRRFKIGDLARFRSWAYPSLSGKMVQITGLPDSDYHYYGVLFLEDNLKMAVAPSELV